MSNITVKHIGMKLLNYRYNLHLFELVEKVTYIGTRWTFGLNLEKLAHKAHKVIVCEYNRAQITQVWMKLPELPLVVSNKPIDSGFDRCSPITQSDSVKVTIEKLKGKKIILYQGIVDAERPIEPIANAIEVLNDEYICVVMTGSECNYLSKYKKQLCYHI